MSTKKHHELSDKERLTGLEIERKEKWDDNHTIVPFLKLLSHCQDLDFLWPPFSQSNSAVCDPWQGSNILLCPEPTSDISQNSQPQSAAGGRDGCKITNILTIRPSQLKFITVPFYISSSPEN